MRSFYLNLQKDISARHSLFKKFTVLLPAIALLLYNGTLTASNKYSIANGNWVGGSTWSHTSGGPTCGCTPGGSDSVFISHNITLNKNLTGGSGISALLFINSGATLNGGSTYNLDVKATGTLRVSGTLIINNTTFFNGSNVFVNPLANVTVNGTLENKNNSNSVFINGPVTVLGSLINGNGSVISGTGPINVSNGPISNIGNIFGCTGIPSETFPVSLPGPCPSPLPVALINFDADASKKNEIILNWTTASEVNNSFFTIEKSPDAKRFIKIADITGAGNTSARSVYSFTDKSIENAAYYYRLSQTDFNGNDRVLKIINVQNKTNECIRIQAENNTGEIKINFTCNQNNTATVSINDFVGKSISNQVINLNNANGNTYSFSILNPGMYIVTVAAGNTVIKKQVWKF